MEQSPSSETNQFSQLLKKDSAVWSKVGMTNAGNVKFCGLGMAIGDKRLSWRKYFLGLQLRDVELIT
jgi:hypothetical protein